MAVHARDGSAADRHRRVRARRARAASACRAGVGMQPPAAALPASVLRLGLRRRLLRLPVGRGARRRRLRGVRRGRRSVRSGRSRARLRRFIYSSGNSIEPSAAYRAFRGRDAAHRADAAPARPARRSLRVVAERSVSVRGYACATGSTSLPKFSPLKSLSSASGKCVEARDDVLAALHTAVLQVAGELGDRLRDSGRRSRTPPCLPCARG